MGASVRLGCSSGAMISTHQFALVAGHEIAMPDHY